MTDCAQKEHRSVPYLKEEGHTTSDIVDQNRHARVCRRHRTQSRSDKCAERPGTASLSLARSVLYLCSRRNDMLLSADSRDKVENMNTDKFAGYLENEITLIQITNSTILENERTGDGSCEDVSSIPD